MVPGVADGEPIAIPADHINMVKEQHATRTDRHQSQSTSGVGRVLAFDVALVVRLALMLVVP